MGWHAQAAPILDFPGVRRLEMRISSGKVKVTGADATAAKVSVNKKRYDERCKLVIKQRGDLLFIELASRSLYTARCEADFDITVPQSIDLAFKDGSGDISVEGTAGTISAEMGSGQLNVKGKVLDFRGRTGSGDVKVDGLEDSASVRTGSGHVHLVYQKTPKQGEVKINSGSGDAVVLFPKRTKVKTKFSAGTGVLKNLLGDTPSADITVTMKSGSGDLMVGKF